MSFWDIFKIFLVLLILLGLMYALLYVVKKYFYSFDLQGSRKFKMDILSTQSLMPKKFVTLVRINGMIYILGITDHAISLIDKFEEEEEYPLDYPVSKPEGGNFLDIFKKFSGK